MTRLNTLVKNVTVVRPDTGADGGEQLDIGITDGTFSRLEPNIPAEDADVVVDGRGLLAFPGVVDAHQHWGIYNSLRGRHRHREPGQRAGRRDHGPDLHAHGPVLPQHRRPLPRVLPQGAGRVGGALVHRLRASTWRPCRGEHIDEIPSIITDFGVTSFKIFMFYGSHGLHGPRRTRARSS